MSAAYAPPSSVRPAIAPSDEVSAIKEEFRIDIMSSSPPTGDKEYAMSTRSQLPLTTSFLPSGMLGEKEDLLYNKPSAAGSSTTIYLRCQE